jgi:hypothetical protein
VAGDRFILKAPLSLGAAMSSYLIVKIRTAADGRVTEAVMRQIEMSPRGDQMLSLMDEQQWGSTGIANLIACGHSVYVGVQGAKGGWPMATR